MVLEDELMLANQEVSFWFHSRPAVAPPPPPPPPTPILLMNQSLTNSGFTDYNLFHTPFTNVHHLMHCHSHLIQ